MATPFFQYIPDFEYVSRLPGASLGDYITVKNLFRRAKINPDIFNNLTNFTKYKIIGDERPDQVAYKIYGSQYYDWIVLLSNNIINLIEEWPLSQQAFSNYMTHKYGNEGQFNEAHHYETTQIKDTAGRTMLPAGLEVPSDYSFQYLDTGTLVNKVNPVSIVSNYDYEDRLQRQKRNIFLLQPRFINNAITNLEDIMRYRKGSSQYVGANLVKGDEIRIYQ